MKKPTAGSLLAVGWKLGLAFQSLPSPEAHIVDFFIVVVIDLVEIMRMAARDNISP